MASPLYLNPDFLAPGRMGAPRFVGGAVEGGTSLSGISLASDVTGGGLVAVDYDMIQLQGGNRDQILYYNRLMTVLHGGIRKCVVPLMTDIYAPCKDSAITGDVIPYTRTTFSDSSEFSDTSQFSQPPVAGAFLGDFAVGAATVNITVVGGRALQGGEWFGVQHVNKSFRAYVVTDVDTQTAFPNGNFNAHVGIRPPLRDLVAQDQPIDWWRPRCLMKIKTGSDAPMSLESYWRGSVGLSFVEAFD